MSMKGKDILVSVIVLTYNSFNNIESNLNSIIEQDYPYVEIIISDDGSKEFPYRKIESVLSKSRFSYIIEINENNVGTVKNYNKAICISKGDIIIPLAQDDTFYDSGCISEIVNAFESTNYSVYTAKRTEKNTKEIKPDDYCRTLIESHNYGKMAFCLLIRNFISGSVLYLHKRRLVEQLGTFKFNEDYMLLEDYPFLINAVRSRMTIGFIDKVMILYGEKGVSSKKKKISPYYQKDIIRLYEDEIIPAVSSIKNEAVKEYIKYQYLKYKTFGNTKGRLIMMFYLLTHPKLLLLLITLSINSHNSSLGKMSYRYEYLYKSSHSFKN